jgi:hypothetical protein
MLLHNIVTGFTTREKEEKIHLSRIKSDFKYFFHHVVLLAVGKQKIFKYSKSFLLQAEYVVATLEGDFTRVAISIPPRNAKSLIWSVALPMWEWLTNPQHRFIQVSHHRDNLTQFQIDRQRVFKNIDYQRIAEWDLTKDTVEEFYNSAGGHILSMVMINVTTGLGGDTLLVDDPISAGDAENHKMLKKVWMKYTRTLLSRLDDKETGRIIVISQRLAVNDVIDNVVKAGYHYVKLQAIQEIETTFEFPRSKEKWFRDSGDILNPLYESMKILDELRKLDPEGFQAQYQQEPVVIGSGVISFTGIKKYNEIQKEYKKIILSVDSAGTVKETSSNWGLGVFGLYYEYGEFCLDILYAHADKYEYPSGKAKVIELIKRWEITDALIEFKSTGVALAPELESLQNSKIPEMKIPKHNVTRIVPCRDKESRAIACAPFMNAGRLRTPNGDLMPYTTGWMARFNLEIKGFPNEEKRDVLDMTTQVINNYSGSNVSVKAWFNLQ